MTITIEQIRDKYKAIAEEFKVRQAELEVMIEEYKKQQEEAEFPKDGDVYYYIGDNGIIYTRKYSKYDTFDQSRLSIGNYFRTQEEAEFTREQLKVIADMKSCGGVWKTKSEGCGYYPWTFDNLIHVARTYADRVTPNIIFPTEEAAQKAIDTIGEERLMKYWFCEEVKE